MSRIITLTGISGSGKSTIEKELLKNGLDKIVSVTTRAKRKGETNGDDYFFLTDEEFDNILDTDGMAEYVEFNGKSYGISKDEIEGKLTGGDVVVVVEPNGLEQLKRIYGDKVLSVFIYCDRLTAFNRMFLKRGDSMKDSLSRLKNDYETIYKSPERIKYDLIVDGSNNDIEGVTESILSGEYRYREVYDLIED